MPAASPLVCLPTATILDTYTCDRVPAVMPLTHYATAPALPDNAGPPRHGTALHGSGQLLHLGASALSAARSTANAAGALFSQCMSHLHFADLHFINRKCLFYSLHYLQHSARPTVLLNKVDDLTKQSDCANFQKKLKIFLQDSPDSDSRDCVLSHTRERTEEQGRRRSHLRVPVGKQDSRTHCWPPQSKPRSWSLAPKR